MERLSNNYQDLMNQVEIELQSLELDKGENVLIAYSEIPWFPGGQFCISAVKTQKDNRIKLVKQVWDSSYDLDRFSTGVYNLDRLCIHKTTTELSPAQQSELTNTIDCIAVLPNALNDDNYFVLDGIDYQLTLNTKKIEKKYQWKVATKDIQLFKPLIKFLQVATSDK